MPQTIDLRDCRLYRFWVEHPVTGEEVLGYVGETVRQPFDRLMEHVGDKPWMDTVTRWERDSRVFAGKRAVLDAEAAAIRDERPLYNVKGNERNDERIPPPLAIRQRRARDLERDKPRWVHPDDRDAVRPVPTTAVRRVSGTRSWPAVRRRRDRRGLSVKAAAASWIAAWLTIAVMTGRFVVESPISAASQRAWVIALVPTVFVAFGHWLGPQAWKAFKRSLKRRIRDIF